MKIWFIDVEAKVTGDSFFRVDLAKHSDGRRLEGVILWKVDGPDVLGERLAWRFFLRRPYNIHTYARGTA